VIGGTGVTAPIAGNLIKSTSPNGQSLFVQSLLPETQKAAVSLVEPFYPVAWLEPSQSGPIVNSAPGESGYRLQIEEPTKPMTARFLNVLQGADAGQTVDAVTLIHTNSGTPFDGVAIQRAAGPIVVLFLRDLSAAASFSSATWPLAPNASLTYVADLKPATPYKVSVQNGQVMLSSDPSASGNTVTTDGAGVLRF
jgi:hypothetical protein